MPVGISQTPGRHRRRRLYSSSSSSSSSRAESIVIAVILSSLALIVLLTFVSHASQRAQRARVAAQGRTTTTTSSTTLRRRYIHGRRSTTMRRMKRRDVKCVVGVVTAVWDASRMENAMNLCDKLTNSGVQTVRRIDNVEEEGGDGDAWKSRERAVFVRNTDDQDKTTTTAMELTEANADDEGREKDTGVGYTVDECVVFAGTDGRQIDGDFLVSLASAGDVIAPSLRENKRQHPGKKTKRGSSSRLGFEGPGSVANAMSHSALAEYFVDRENTTATDDDRDCFIMLEDDAAPVPDFDAKLGSLLAALDEEGRGTWDVINLNGASKLVLMNVACLVVKNVDSFYAYGSFTRSIGLAFSRTGIERFLGARPIDTHIDLFLDKLVRRNDLYGIRTCEPLVSNLLLDDDDDEKEGNEDDDSVQNSSDSIGRRTGTAYKQLPSAKQIVNDHERLTLEMWLRAEKVYHQNTVGNASSPSLQIFGAPSEEVDVVF